MTDRTQYIDGLRELADLLDKHDDLALPSSGNTTELVIHFLSTADPKGDLQRFARLVPGKVDKRIWASYFDLEVKLGGPDGLTLRASAMRDAVCERVVTGTREVTEMVPDPKVSVQLVEVTKTVEDVEWQCGSLLSPEGAVS